MSQLSDDRPRTSRGKRGRDLVQVSQASSSRSNTKYDRTAEILSSSNDGGAGIEPWSQPSDEQFTLQSSITDVLDFDTGMELHSNRNQPTFNTTEIDGRPKTSHSMRIRRGSQDQVTSHVPVDAPLNSHKTNRSMSVDMNEIGDRPKTGHGRPARKSVGDPGMIAPSPPPYPPTSTRKMSGKRRNVNRRQSQESEAVFLENPEIRPTSAALTRYRPLPAIGKKPLSSTTTDPTSVHSEKEEQSIVDITLLQKQVYECTLSDAETPLERSASEIPLPKDTLFPEEHHLPSEPEGNENRVLLAVKLPNGKRLQRFFRPYEKLILVLKFAENALLEDLSECILVCPMPLTEYRDLNMTISEAGLQNRTILHVQRPDG